MNKLISFIWTETIGRIIYGHIGKGCYIGKTLYVKKKKHVFLGNSVRVYPGLRAETVGNGVICFEGDNSVGQNLHIVSGAELKIGEGTTISSNVFISNIDHTYTPGKSALSTPIEIKQTVIGKHCFVGTGAVILPGSVIGNNVIIGANSTVRGGFPDNCIIAGSPAKIIKRIDV